MLSTAYAAPTALPLFLLYGEQLHFRIYPLPLYGSGSIFRMFAVVETSCLLMPLIEICCFHQRKCYSCRLHHINWMRVSTESVNFVPAIPIPRSNHFQLNFMRFTDTFNIFAIKLRIKP